MSLLKANALGFSVEIDEDGYGDIYSGREWAGSCTWNGHQITDCSAPLEEEVFEALETELARKD